ncbi:L,D-transpeptidase family protein [Cecembia lonarensis]|uniref:Murein L,D-transpeptidase n=1 Tax=Cecembia lonarensis (strain CCUG 58316 / KCTC 22772 / LW9) TaxID=1225176 RepID=K1L9G0_CECL9|nr:L,D-transpeptidase family protein [Cecembia lonarensis]EKB48807.1 murein L,D-transpeptidase [Cecembia lonarensis LW9]
MRNLILFFLLFVWIPLLGQEITSTQNGSSFYLRTFLEPTDPSQKPLVQGQMLFSSVVVHRFYTERDFQVAWLREDTVLLELAYEMRYEIQQSKFDGLQPADYHLQAIDGLFMKYEAARSEGRSLSRADMGALDLLLSDAFVMLASHLYHGKVDPEQLRTVWNIQRSAPDLYLDQRLSSAIQAGSIRRALQDLYPSFTIYRPMREGLRQLYNDFERFQIEQTSSWKELKISRSLKVGDNSPIIPDVVKRLSFWGFLPNDYESQGKGYDAEIEEAVKKLQLKFGMESDGVIGQGTIYALNQSPQDLIKKTSINLERLRWLPDNLKEQELIIVNTANFQFDFIQQRDTVLTSRVIVGRSFHSTPQFSAQMSYLVFSPTWTVPPSILRQEVIPGMRKDPQYMAKRKMRLLTFSGQEVPTSSVDWSKVSAAGFPYMVRQDPGEHNSLGLVKFMFPNKHHVYIHDTPARSLFEREDRALSYGCIRIQKPVELAKLLLQHDEGWTDERINSAMRQSREQVVNLDRKIPVVILYLTYWTTSDGRVFFRRDIYNRDNEVYQALIQRRG